MRTKKCPCCQGTGSLQKFPPDAEYTDIPQCSVCAGTGEVVAELDSDNIEVVITFGPNQEFFSKNFEEELPINRRVVLMNKTTGKIDLFSHVFTDHVKEWMHEKELGWDDGKDTCPNWKYNVVDHYNMIVNYPRDKYLLMIENRYFDWFNPFQINIQYIFHIENESTVGEMLELISNKLETLSKNYASAVPISVAGKDSNQFYITNYTFHNVLGGHWRKHILNVVDRNLCAEIKLPSRWRDDDDEL